MVVGRCSFRVGVTDNYKNCHTVVYTYCTIKFNFILFIFFIKKIKKKKKKKKIITTYGYLERVQIELIIENSPLAGRLGTPRGGAVCMRRKQTPRSPLRCLDVRVFGFRCNVTDG